MDSRLAEKYQVPAKKTPGYVGLCPVIYLQPAVSAGHIVGNRRTGCSKSLLLLVYIAVFHVQPPLVLSAAGVYSSGGYFPLHDGQTP